MVLIHIFAGLLAIAAGAFALSAAKGGRLHREAGRIFVAAMLVMAGLGAGLAAAQLLSGHAPRVATGNMVAGAITCYLTGTAWLTIRRPRSGGRWIDAGAMLFALAFGLFAIKLGVGALYTSKGKLSWFPSAPLLTMGAIGLLAAWGDMRMLASGGLLGNRRIARHLWRMCLAMFVATASFFLGQARVLPEPLRVLPLQLAPVVLVLLAWVYWLVRVRFTRWSARDAALQRGGRVAGASVSGP